MVQGEKMNCSIITIHHIHNFGSVFQAYALYRFLTDNGYNVETIDYRPPYYENGKNSLKTYVGKLLNLHAYRARKKKFENFIKAYNHLTKNTYTSLDELARAYAQSDDVFIAGGDQLWNNYHPCGNDDAYKLTFTQGKKLAYGTSMGRDNFEETELATLGKKVNDFSHIMLREAVTVPQLSAQTQVEVSHVIDPVGLLDPDHFKEMVKKPDMKEPYAVMYLSDAGEVLDAAIEHLSKKMGLKIVHICGFRKKCYCDRFEKSAGPEEILGYILHADFVLSASFHATMFSLLFNKKFATLLPGTKTNARIEDILNYVGLSHRILHTVDDLDELNRPIDFEKANLRISALRERSAQALLNALENLSKE